MDDVAVPDVDRPSSPSVELAARRSWNGPALANGVLTAELAEFCQSGVSLVISSCDRGGRPVVGRGLACLIDGSGELRVVLRRPSNGALLQALGEGGRLAITFTKPSTHRSIQLKSSGATIAPSEASDRRAAAAQAGGLRAELIDDGFTDSLATAYCAFEPDELVAVRFIPEQAFVQTPGPGAGSPLQP